MTNLNYTPSFNTTEVQILSQKIFGIQGTLTPLPSERDQNFRLRTENGENYVLKIASAAEDIQLLEAQNLAMAHLNQHGVRAPKVIPTKNGETITQIESGTGQIHAVRLVSYLSGTPYGEVGRHSPELFHNLGAYLGRLDRAFASFDHPAIHRDFYWDLANALDVVNEYQSLIITDELRILVEKFTNQFQQNGFPLLPELRQSAIHNDANDYNVIVGGGDDLYSRDQQIVGVIDFGDMLHSYTVAELAVAIAYAILDKADPLAAAIPLVRGYHQENPLSEDELAALFGLVTMRLCMSICIAAHQTQQRPEDAYLSISQDSIHKTLPKLAEIHPCFAEVAFRQACGLRPHLRTEKVTQWLQSKPQFSPILEIDLGIDPLIIFDLGISSPLLGADQISLTESHLTPRLFSQLEKAEVKVAIGQYDEAWLLYTTPAFNTGDKLTDEHRIIHLGIDLFAAPGTAVYAPLDGHVYAFHDNDAAQDYGPVIILEHPISDSESFFTLYGHLSRASLAGRKKGQKIIAGDKLGEIGTAEVNGGWTPHLHFQIITDLLDLDCDFPGVCRASQRQLWKALSPDPNLILRIPEGVLPRPQLSKAQTLAARRKLIGRNLSIGYNEPLKIVRGWKQYLFDETGRRYVDAYNNVPHVGHCHPRVVAAGREQMGILNTNTRYLHDNLHRYAQKIIATLPKPLRVCFFVNSGSEANELALRLARAYTGAKDMLVMESAYHGHTTSLIDISPYKHDGPGGRGAPTWVHSVPIPDTYRGLYKANDPQAVQKYALHVQKSIEQLQAVGSKLAAFIAETCPSVGGQIFLPPGYLSQVYEYVRQAGGLCIVDEVQTGYGRTGTHFYAFEDHGVVPDIVVLGKPIGNGHPIGVVITRPEIAAAFDNGMEFFSTFGGNTVSCAIGMAVLDVVLDENLQDHALEVGNYLLEGLRRFEADYTLVGDVRGSGLFLGVELVLHPETLEPATTEAAFIANRMRELGVLLGTDGPDHNVLKIRPPMPFSIEDADLLLGAMDQILWEDFGS